MSNILWVSNFVAFSEYLNLNHLQNLCRKSVSLKSQKHKNVDAIFKIQKGSGPIIEVKRTADT